MIPKNGIPQKITGYVKHSIWNIFSGFKLNNQIKLKFNKLNSINIKFKK